MDLQSRFKELLDQRRDLLAAIAADAGDIAQLARVHSELTVIPQALAAIAQREALTLLEDLATQREALNDEYRDISATIEELEVRARAKVAAIQELQAIGGGDEERQALNALQGELDAAKAQRKEALRKQFAIQDALTVRFGELIPDRRGMIGGKNTDDLKRPTWRAKLAQAHAQRVHDAAQAQVYNVVTVDS